MNSGIKTQLTPQENSSQFDEMTAGNAADDESTSRKRNRQPDSREDYVELKYRTVRDVGAEKIAVGLGWFSIGLGLAELLAPKKLGNLIGIDKQRRSLLPFFGLREIASGIGILAMPRPAGAVWSRVGGDALDLTFLGSALASGKTEKSKVAVATLAVLGVTAIDIVCAQRLSQTLDETAGNPEAPTTIGQSSGRKTVD
jgi:hypothetical protein